MTRKQEIYERALPEMKSNGIDDTIENRIVFLNGMYDACKEDADISFNKTLRMVALNSEICSLKLKLDFS
jgi:hypothetical protein